MLVPVRGMAVNAGEQTGDGRYIVPGALTWANLPLPFAYLIDGDQHADLSEVCPQVGNMTQLLPVTTGVAFLGHIDDEIPAGAESLRRMRAGSASLGNRMAVSIDPDDYAVQIVDASPMAGEGILLLAAAGVVPEGQRIDWNAPLRSLARAGLVPALVAAAGDGDPLVNGGEILFEDAADWIIQRYTRLRIRGATMCAVAAFTGCYVELDDDGAGFAALPEIAGTTVAPTGSATDSGSSSASISVTTTIATGAEGDVVKGLAAGLEEAAPAVAEAVAAAAAPAVPARTQINLAAPPSSWFENPSLPFATPLTITNEGRLIGHVAAWETCHTGYTDRCVTPPRGDYDRFHVGEVVCSDGSRAATGVFAWGIPHADLTLPLIDAWAHYSDSRYGFARVASGEDSHGIWFSGALFPGLSEADISILRALSMSGDWRRDPRTKRLSLVAALAVNFPGYPIPRGNGSAITASIGGEVVDVESWESPETLMRLEGDEVMALVACGRLTPRASSNPDCGCSDGDDLRVRGLEARLARTERLVANLLPQIAAGLDERVAPA